MNHTILKHISTLIAIAFLGNVHPSFAQEEAINSYLESVNDYSYLHSGQLEMGYNRMAYTNTPYFLGQDYVAGTITFNGIVYPNQRIRFDLHKKHLVVLLPKKQLAKVVDPAKTAQFTIHGITFVKLSPTAESKLPTDFYSLLLEGKHFTLYGREYSEYHRTLSSISTTFVHKSKYYLFMNNTYYPITGKKSFTKLFPAFKKEINNMVKDQELDFRKEKVKSIIQVATYCDELLMQSNNR